MKCGVTMKEQYVGDISDYRKYALLRALADGDRNRIGICWMLTPPDGRSDGNKLAYLDQPERYRDFDPDLFDLLKGAAAVPDDRRLRSIKESGIIPGAVYFNDTLPDDREGRAAYMTACSQALRDVDLVFFDPDNGMEVAKKKGHRDSSKYVYLDEIASFYAAGKSVLIYQHFPRVKRDVFLERCRDRLAAIAPFADLWAFTTKHMVFLLLAHPANKAYFSRRASEVCACLDTGLIAGHRMDPRAPTQPADAP